MIARLRMTRPACDGGFTLAEVLVSLFVFGLVSTLILAVLDIEGRADAAVRRNGDAIEQVVTAQTILRGRIEAMHPEVSAQETLTVEGTQTDFGFEAPIFTSAGPHALHFFRVGLTPQHQLMLRYVSERSGLDLRQRDVSGWSSMTLLDGVEAIEFTYFGPDRVTGRDTWQQSWQGRRVAPKLIRMRLAFAPGDPRAWPVLLMRPWSSLRKTCDQNQTGADCGVRM